MNLADSSGACGYRFDALRCLIAKELPLTSMLRSLTLHDRMDCPQRIGHWPAIANCGTRNYLMAFTGALRFFNSKFTLPEQRAAFLGGNAPLGLTAQNLDELVAWLSLDVSNSDAACKASWSGLRVR